MAHSQFELWKEYEKVAMHFNDLLIQLRMRALGGIGLLISLTGLALKGEDGALQWELVVFVLCFLVIAWGAIYCLDVLYYNRLLLGAAKATTQLEQKSAEKHVDAQINLSGWIGAAQNNNKKFDGVDNKWKASRAVHFFYAVILFMLIAGAFLAFYKAYCS